MKKILLLVGITFFISSCAEVSLAQSKVLAEDGLIKDWIGLQLQLIRKTTGVPHIAYSRHFAYTGVALYGALVKAEEHKIVGGLNVSQAASTRPLFPPAAVNAAIADMLRFFYGGNLSNLVDIDSLETVNITKFSPRAQLFDLPTSIKLGKEVAARIIEISKTDGASNASIAYTPPGKGYWEPTDPGYAAAALPGWGNNKLIVNGSTSGISCPVPPTFSTSANSSFYAMAKEVYDVWKRLTPEEKAVAKFWDDSPNGKYYTVFGHWFSILKQVLEHQSVSLQTAAKAYLQLGASMNDAGIYCWRVKFNYNQLRPISYIRQYMDHASWNPFLTTPNHPEYVAAHATLSSAAAFSLEAMFGNDFHFTDHSYDDIDLQPRSFTGFKAAADEAGLSRLYGGIHYGPSIQAGEQLGRAVAAKVDSVLSLPRFFMLWEE